MRTGKLTLIIKVAILLVSVAIAVPIFFLLNKSTTNPGQPNKNPGTNPGPAPIPGPGPQTAQLVHSNFAEQNLSAIPVSADMSKLTKDANSIYHINKVDRWLPVKNGDPYQPARPPMGPVPSGREGFQYNVLDNGTIIFEADTKVLTKAELKTIADRFMSSGFYTAGIRRIKKIYFDRYLTNDPIEGGASSPLGSTSPQDDRVHIFLKPYLNHPEWTTPDERKVVMQMALLTLMHEYGHQETFSSFTKNLSVTHVPIESHFDFLEAGNPNTAHPGIEYSFQETLRDDTMGYDKEVIKDFYYSISYQQRKYLKDWFGIDVTKDKLWRTSPPTWIGSYSTSFDELLTRELLQLTGRTWTDAHSSTISTYDFIGDYEAFKKMQKPAWGDSDDLPYGGKVPAIHRIDWMNSMKMFDGDYHRPLTPLGLEVVKFYKRLFRYDQKIDQPFIVNGNLNIPFWLTETDAQKYDGVLAYDGSSFSKTPLVKVSNAFNMKKNLMFGDDYRLFTPSDVDTWDRQTYLAEFKNINGSQRNLWFYKDKNNDGKLTEDEITTIGLPQKYEHTWNDIVCPTNSHLTIEPQTIALTTIESTLIKWN